MAHVYRGLDENLGRLAAVKVLHITPEDREDDRIVERFRLEARAIARFEHPNIITVYQFGETDDLIFIAMKLVAGDTLSQRIRRSRRTNILLPLDTVLQVTRDVSDALDYAHARSIIHRDVKPANILFDSAANNRAILTDFGLAMELGGNSTLGTAFGTPRYIAPEQAVSSLQAVPQSDIYALAVVVFEMLTGQVPFQDDSPMSVALYHITSEPPKPRTLNPLIPSQVEQVLLRALAKEPQERYRTAGEFYEALELAYKDSEIELPTQPVPFELEDKMPAFRDSPPPEPAREQATEALRQTKQQPRPERGKRTRSALRSRVGLVLVMVVVLLGFWLANGQSFWNQSTLSNMIQDVFNGAVSFIEDLTGNDTDVASIPDDVELQFELIVSGDYLAIHNLSDYTLPLKDLRLDWGDGETHTAEALFGVLPPQQCSWIRLLADGTRRLPAECPNPEYRLRMITDPDDLFWAAYETFRVLSDNDELGTCRLANRRCAFVLPH